MSSKCAILYSGGSDSTAAAATMAEQYGEVHLVTYWELATARSPDPVDNIERLRKAFPKTKIHFHKINIDSTLIHLSYAGFFSSLLKYHLLNLATPGLSTLSWHTEMIRFCKSQGIAHVADGLTRELMHFPGHQDFFVDLAKRFYSEAGINYTNPVRDWPCPPDFQLVHKLVVDFHLGERAVVPGSTGEFLQKKGIFSEGNIKGSRHDQSMQKDCYPFVVYNILVFWVFQFLGTRAYWENKMVQFFTEKFAMARKLLEG